MWSDIPCKIWTKGKDSSGYPMVWRNGETVSLTRIVLAGALGRPIKDGYECGHYCNTPSCYELEHLYEVTHTRNVRDAYKDGIVTIVSGWGLHNARKTHCPQGHEYSGKNLGLFRGCRYCKECNRIKAKKKREGKRNACSEPHP